MNHTPAQSSTSGGISYPQHSRSLSGSSLTGPSNSSNINNSSHEPLNSRSCVTCRRRKVRCNKRTPCSNCAKAGIECVFPAPGRAPRKPRRPQDAELLSRLRRLEGVIDQIKDKKPENTSPPAPPPVENVPVEGHHEQPQQKEIGKQEGEEMCPYMDPNFKRPAPRNLENEFGRLVIDEGRSRYVSNRFWASMGDEIEELQDILDPSSSEDEDYPSPQSSTNSASHDGFLFGFYSLSHSLRSYHPTPEQVNFLWNVYLENVAPLISIFHKPTLQKLFVGPAQNPGLLDKNSEALVLTIYFVAIISLSPEQCRSKLGEERDSLVRRYRFAVEQALAKANFLNTQNLMLLQTVVLFLIAVRREDDTKFVWAMNSVVLRLAQGLGLHRDGTNFKLRPFETEMRRRLWWHICLLDIRSSEDHGTDAQIHERLYDTQLPLNINDDDIKPEMQEPPPEHESCTEMTFSLVRFEITSVLRRVSYTSCPSGKSRFGNTQPPPESCGNMIHAVNRRMEERYIKHCDMSIPIYWVCATVARLILAKLWLIIHHPMTRNDRQVNISHSSRESLFFTSVEVIDFCRLMQTNEHTAKWGWLMATNTQWHAIAFVLSELCVRPVCPITDRAWAAVQSVYGTWEQNAKHKKGMLWRPLSRLMKRAAAFRAKQYEEMQAEFGPSPGVPGPSSLTAPVSQASMGLPLSQSLPRIHFPSEILESTSVPSQETFGQSPGMGLDNLDISKGPIGVLENLFPDTDFFALNTSTQPSSGRTDALAGVPDNPMPPVGNQQGPSNSQLNWEEWDQVMRDFQMDLEGAEVNQPLGNVSDWLA